MNGINAVANTVSRSPLGSVIDVFAPGAMSTVKGLTGGDKDPNARIP